MMGNAGVRELLSALSAKITARLRSAYRQGAFRHVNARPGLAAGIEIRGDGPGARLVVRITGAGAGTAWIIEGFVRDILGDAEFTLECRA